ncbi:hypothetical protein CEXT_428871 [Caerostris extrusa]|uniref:Uncharacterized protein n=1 Tax=Caerostris extrusa TaxID=172846 RepID=A0AAV4MJX4_CAEEX|nr:hypothetical protein CEXT_428871 [Caerostris extrusa]
MKRPKKKKEGMGLMIRKQVHETRVHSSRSNKSHKYTLCRFRNHSFYADVTTSKTTIAIHGVLIHHFWKHNFGVESPMNSPSSPFAEPRKKPLPPPFIEGGGGREDSLWMFNASEN